MIFSHARLSFTSYLKTTFLVAFIGLVNLATHAQENPITLNTSVGDHPRILLLKTEEDAIKKAIQTDTILNKIHRSILTESNKLIVTPVLERIMEGRRLLSVSREALRRVFFLSYAWRMTGEQKYLDRTEKELLAVSAFNDWNPSHFLDVGEMTMAVAIGYDWTYNNLSQNSRSIIQQAILKKGIEPSLDNKNNGWLQASHNWNQVCNAGITFGALAIYESDPALAVKLVNRAIKSIELPMKDYAPDGAYPEGHSYWGYGTSFNVLFIDALEKTFGSDFGLTQKPGFLQSASYMQNMTGPTLQSFNYSDSFSEGGFNPAMFWFAKKQNNFSLLWIERQYILRDDGMKNRLLPATLLWAGKTNSNNIRKPETRSWVGGGKNPVALLHSSWGEANSIFVGLKAGSPSVNHGHMDVGSFIMEADGVRWAQDFGAQEYNSLESKGLQIWGMTQNSQRWQVYRYTNYAHNTLTVNNELQKVEGYASINKHSKLPQFIHAVTDISTLYEGLLTKAKRGVAIVDKKYVLVRDEYKTAGKASTIRWNMLTSATVKIIDKTHAELNKDGKKLLIEVTDPKITLKTWTTTPPNDYDAPNTGTTFVGFEVKVPANTRGQFDVFLIPQSAGKVIQKKGLGLDKWPN